MTEVFCHCYVEDAPSAAVAKRLVEYRNAMTASRICLRDGSPVIMRGQGALRRKSPAFLQMAKAGLFTLALTDLDTQPCAAQLILDWFQILDLPRQVMFRVAVHEIEAWIMADREAWAQHIGISAANFPENPDGLLDPKQSLLNTIRKKGTRRLHKEMLPTGTAHIGPRYNEVLCNFVEEKWCPRRASQSSPSLNRAVEALLRV